LNWLPQNSEKETETPERSVKAKNTKTKKNTNTKNTTNTTRKFKTLHYLPFAELFSDAQSQLSNFASNF